MPVYKYRTIAFATGLLLCAVATADVPSIVGPRSDSSDAIRVKVGSPPWFPLSVKGAPDGAVQTWIGPIGEGKVAFFTRDGVGVTTVLPGTYQFRCRLQIPKEGLDEIIDVETTVTVEGSGPGPVPDVIPTPTDWAKRLTEAVKAKPQSHEGLSRVADLYGKVADWIKSGTLKTTDQVKAMTGLASEASPEWPALDAAIVQPHLATLTLANASDYEPVLRQIRSAIKAGLTDIPPPDVVPIPTTTLHVLIVEEADERGTLPASQVSIFTSTDLRKWLTESKAQWRIFDKDVPQEQLADVWKAGLKKVSESGLQLPVVLVSNGAKGTIEKLPKSVGELTTLLEKYR